MSGRRSFGLRGWWRWTLVGAVLASIFLGAGGSAGRGGPERSAAAVNVFIVRQQRFGPQLIVRTDRVEIGYKAQRGPNLPETASATGTLYVRNDLMSRFRAVPLELRKGLQQRGLWAVVPQRLIVGERLFYYAVIRDRVTGKVVTVPARGPRTPESAWIVNDALRVRLGAITYGRFQSPQAIVARAQPGEVGFGRDGLVYGPSSFEVAKDGAVWLFDSVHHRLLQWLPGKPGTIARTVTMAGGWDFALGPAGSIYVISKPGPSGRLTRLSPSGKVLWTSPIAAGGQGQLRTGPDGSLYWTGTMGEARDMSNWMPRWIPLATPAGRPLPLAAQWHGTRWTQPLPGGLQLVASSADWEQARNFGPAPHEARLAIVDRSGHVVRAWRVTSRTIIWWYAGKATPALADGDPVIVLTPHWPTHATGRQLEYLVLRLGPGAEVRSRFALPDGKPPQSAYGDEPFVVTEIRVGPDDNLYQLGSAPDFGAAIYRHDLRK